MTALFLGRGARWLRCHVRASLPTHSTRPREGARTSGRRSALSARPVLLLWVLLILSTLPAQAQVNVGTEDELRDAIFDANIGGDTTINLIGDVTLTQSLPMISSDITLDGGNFTIDANDTGRIFSSRAAR